MDTEKRLTITDYINFCRDTVIPVQTIQGYPNNKTWIISDLKDLLIQKRKVLQDGDREELRSIQQEHKKTLRRAKGDYRKKVERQLENNITMEVWRRTVTGYKMKNSQPVEHDVDRANTFNRYYNKFDSVAAFTITPAAAPSTSISAVALSTSVTAPYNSNSAPAP